MQLAAYLLIINLLTIFLYWHDKRCARYQTRRVPEYILLLVGFLGGTLGAIFAMFRFRHKTRKGGFQFKFWMLTCVQIGLLLFPPTSLKLGISRLLGA